ncbi:MAG: ABC transporter substrate-binding protein [Proteobacteria bacterium]|nr:ABC transporter substrate-binding protein [Pseudomonadota bacterium]
MIKSVRLVSLFAVLLAVALGVAMPASAQQKLRVALLRTTAMIPIIDAEKMGYFKREGIETEVITLNNGPAVISAVVSGSADIGWAATMPVISARAERQPIRAFISNNFERWPEPLLTHLIASERSGVKTLADLKGKTVASNATNGGCDLMIRDHIRAAGIPANAMKMVVMPFPQMQAALELGTVDAVCIVDPFYVSAMQSAKIKPKLLAGGMLADLPKIGAFAADAYFARDDWLTKNGKAAAAFLRALSAADKDLAADSAKYRGLLESEFKMPAALAGQITMALNTGSMVVEAKDYKPVIEGLVRTGLLAKPIDAADVIFPVTP